MSSSALISPLERPPWWPDEHSEACIEGRTHDGKTSCDCGDWVASAKRVRAHSAYPELLERYRAARRAWAYLRPRLLIPMEQRPYCDAYVNQGGPITWAGDVTNGLWFGVVVDRAWEDSGVLNG